MKKTGYLFGFFVAAILFLAAGKPITAFAATASFQVSSDTVTQGGTVTVKISVSSDVGMGGYQCAILYDSDKLEWVPDANMGGGGGRVTFVEYNVDGAKQDSFTIQFKTLATGTASVSVEDSSYLMAFDTDLNDLSVSAGSGSIKITAPASYSDNCSLKSLSVYGVDENGNSAEVSFTPGFSSEVTEYNASVSYDVLYYAVQASAEDKGAAVYISDVELSEGSNTTVITVEAENGDTKKYYIYTQKAEKPPVDNSMLEVTAEGESYVIQRNFDDSVLPEGFEKSTLVYNEQTVECGISLNKELTVLYLMKEEGTEGKFFIYDAAANTFRALVRLGMKQKTYTILENEPESVPEGFEKKEVVIDGNKLSLWQKGDFCLFYAVSQDGVKDWYLYDTRDLTVQRFDASFFGLQTVAAGDTSVTEVSAEPEATATDAGNWYSLYKDIRENQKQERKIWTAVTIVLAAAVILCLVITAAVIVRYRKKNDDVYDEVLSCEEFPDTGLPDEKHSDENPENDGFDREETNKGEKPENALSEQEIAEEAVNIAEAELQEEVDEETIELAIEELVSDMAAGTGKEKAPEEKSEDEADDSLDLFEIF